MQLYDNTKDCYIESGDESDFLNDYFINIVRNLGIVHTDNMCQNVYDLDCTFCFPMIYVTRRLEIDKGN